MLNNENYFVVQSWMVQELNLTGNELCIFAIIYGFSQDGMSTFSGTSSYLMSWLNLSQPTVFSVLKKLCEKGYLEKIEKIVNNVKLCDYKVSLGVLKKFKWGTKESLVGGTKEILVHNNIIDNNKEIYKESFENFWSVYPKQRAGSKSKAYQSFCKALKEKRTTEEKLLSAVKIYAQCEEVRRGFAKGCAAWINDDRFNNNYGELKKSFNEMTDSEKLASLRN